MKTSVRQIRVNVQAVQLSESASGSGTSSDDSGSADRSSLIQTGLYNGEEHIIVPCVALIGDGVYYGLHADFPEFVPAAELAYSLPTWAGRPVIPEHPPEGTANTPDRLDDFQYGQIFFPSFTENRLHFDLWLSRDRAVHAGTTWVIEELEAGNMVEISAGASIELEPTSGTTASGEAYGGIWRNIAGDHIAVGLGGGRGACNLDMGCGALRFMSESEMLDAVEADEAIMKNQNQNPTIPQSVRRIAASTSTAAAAAAAPSTPPISANEPPVSFLASLAARMGGLWNAARGLVEDVGQSDAEIRYALTDAIYHIEPGFGWIEEVFQESGTVIYCCFPWSQEEKWYRRTFTRTDSGVTVSDTREEVTNSGGWETVTTPDTPTVVTAAASAKPCGCTNTQQLSATSATPEGEEEEMAKRDEILKRLAALSDEDLEKLATPPVSAPATTTAATTTAPETAPVPAVAPVTTPVAAPVTTPAPAVQTPATAADSATLAAAASAILSASGIDVVALNAMLAGEKAKETQMRESLITALSSRTPDLTRELLTPLPTPQLELMARAAGLIGTAATLGLPVDYSGMGLPVQPAALAPSKKYEAPDPFNLRGEKAKISAAN